MNRRLIGTLLALVLAALGTFVLLVYVRSADDRALAGEQIVEVYVVQERIAEGTAADDLEGLVDRAKIPVRLRADNSVEDLAPLSDMVATVDLEPGEQLLSTRFASPDDLEAQGAVEVPEDLLEVTVSLAQERALGGKIKPGDTVGVLASFDPFEGADPPGDDPPPKTPNSTHLILHKVLVSDVSGGTSATQSGDGQTQTNSGATAGNLMVTLALDAPSVERVVFAAEHGFVWLTNDPETAPEGRTQVQTRGTIYQ